MTKEIKNYNYLKTVLKAIFVVVLFFLSSIFTIIPIVLFNLDIDNLSSTENMLLSIFSYSILLIIIILLYKKSLKIEFKKFKEKFYSCMDCGIKYWLIGLLVMAISNILIGIFFTEATAANEEGVQEIISSVGVISIISIGILGPIIEELVFRKAFREIFHNKWLFIFISSLVFGGLHIFLSLTSIWDLFFLIPYCSMGFAFAFMYVKTNSIYTSMIMHIFHNTVSTTISLLGAMIIL